LPNDRSVFLEYSLYPKEAVDEACLAFKDHLDIERDVSLQAGESLTATRRASAPPETIDEFLSFLLSAASELQLMRLGGT
jgi:hypothetical protein